mmetsp:Transcript_19185/g.33049  ORF Transcript_19185/g.33049 Transcript_19185/m.33049 type:complete len:662 (-) Transcript_19185:545-2530(-)
MAHLHAPFTRLVLLLNVVALGTLLSVSLAEEDVFLLPHTAVDLTETNFIETLEAQGPDTFCLIEFYASWCPHCRYYVPVYEKIARFFKDEAARGGATVFLARTDCALEISLCARFNITAYPLMTAGNASLFISRANTTHYPVGRSRDAKEVVKWMGELLNRTFTYKEARAGKKQAQLWKSWGTKSHSLAPWTLMDVESSTRMLWSQITSMPFLHTGADKRQALLDLVRWWASSHPSPDCQAGAQKLVAIHNVLWPTSHEIAPGSLTKYQICGDPPGTLWKETAESWVTCKGSVPSSRGFTCGLWLLFHTSASRLPAMVSDDQAPAAQIMVTGLRAFGNNFFMCGVCQEHFSQVIARPELDQLKTPKDAVLWVWRTHNEVNSRLAGVEVVDGERTSGDPAYPKVQWPSIKVCPACHLKAVAGRLKAIGPDEPWDEEIVYHYMDRIYHADPPDGVTKDAASGEADKTVQPGISGQGVPSLVPSDVTSHVRPTDKQESADSHIELETVDTSVLGRKDLQSSDRLTQASIQLSKELKEQGEGLEEGQRPMEVGEVNGLKEGQNRMVDARSIELDLGAESQQSDERVSYLLWPTASLLCMVGLGVVGLLLYAWRCRCPCAPNGNLHRISNGVKSWQGKGIGVAHSNGSSSSSGSVSSTAQTLRYAQ